MALEGLGVAASVIAVIELSAKVASLCLEYYSSVKSAKSDINYLLRCVKSLQATAEGAETLLGGPDGARLRNSQRLHFILRDVQADLGELATELETKLNRGRVRRPFGLRSLKWPFEKKAVKEIVAVLQQNQADFSAVLQVDQTVEILNINHKIDISKLPTVRSAIFNSQANEHDPLCHPETRVELLDMVYGWIKHPNEKHIFWLRGMAGTGKSTISRTVAAHLYNQYITSASFFFKKGEGDRGNAKKFFPTVTSQLVSQLPSFARRVQGVIERHSDIADQSKGEQFEKLILRPLNDLYGDCTIPPVIMVVIDALDECDREEDATAIVRLLSRAREITSTHLMFFVTSRPELSIRLGFKDIGDSYKDLALHEVPKSELPSAWPPPVSLQALVSMATPLFISASIACRFISDRDSGHPQEQLDKILQFQQLGLPSHLYTIYLPVLNNILLRRTGSGMASRTDDEKAEILTSFREIVGSIVVLAQPLSPVSLARLLGRSQATVGARLDGLHSVLHVPVDPHATVKLLHLSLRDILVDPKARDTHPFWVNEREIHQNLFNQCLLLLSTGETLKRDVCGVRWPNTSRSKIDQETIDAYLPPVVQYACLHWVYHLKASGGSITDGDVVDAFLNRQFLHWLEAIGLLGQSGINIMKELSGLVDPTRGTKVSTLISDLTRVVRDNRHMIAYAPLQVYYSLLIFASKESAVRKVFKGQYQVGITQSPEVDFEGCTVPNKAKALDMEANSIAFSSDCQNVVLGYNTTIKVWDLAMGGCARTWHGHSGQVLCVTFSPDGQRIASGSRDTTVKIWVVATGRCLMTLQEMGGHTDVVFSVRFSSDGQRVVSASKDMAAKVWDATTGNCLMTLKGHRGAVWSVDFSPAGQHVASASEDGTVKLWEVATGRCLTTFEDHRGIVRSVNFSPDGSCLRTNRGYFVLIPALPGENAASIPQKPLLGLCRQWGYSGLDYWITWSGRPLIWIPRRCRPDLWVSKGLTFAMGRSGALLVLTFSDRENSFG